MRKRREMRWCEIKDDDEEKEMMMMIMYLAKTAVQTYGGHQKLKPDLKFKLS